MGFSVKLIVSPINTKKPRIIVITGTPGTGKTSLAYLLAEKLEYRVISLGEFAKEKNLITKYIKHLDSYDVDLEAMKKALKEEVKPGETVIVEGHVVDVIPAEFVELAIVLRLNPLELEKRLRDRGYKKEKIIANVQSEILDSCLVDAIANFGEEKVFELDTTGKNLNEILEEAIEIIKERKNYKPGQVDWLNFLEKENLLERYMV
ncbi:MAG: kinase [Thermoprotei archaeon]|nr:MAG: kinase [Thermoprotei archaeon]